MNRTRVADSRADGGRDVTGRVVDAVAERRGIDASSVSERLFDVVDPESLAALVAHDGFDGRVEFTYAGHPVTVHGDGRVDVSPAEA